MVRPPRLPVTQSTHSLFAAGHRIAAARVRAVSGAAVGAMLAAFLAVSAFATSVLPYSRWDALYFGAWSRLIAAGDFHARSVGPEQLHRPLFYVAQGLLWNAFGFHEILGRVLSLGFSLLLAAAVYVLARRLDRSRIEALLAVLALTLVPSFAVDVAGGITDVPAAALVAATAAALWALPRGRGSAAVVAAVAAAAALAKPSALVGLAGLALAETLGPRASLRPRLSLGVAPIAAGGAAALVYDAVEAHRLHVSLSSFLTAGTSGFYTRLAAAMRGDVLLRGEWLGPDLRLLLAFGLVYAAVRAAGAAVRRSAATATVVAALATWLLPSLADGGPALGAGPFGGGLGWHGVVYLALLALLPLTVLAPEEDGLDRLWSARLLVWGLLPLAAWAAKAAYADRLVSPAWPRPAPARDDAGGARLPSSDTAVVQCSRRSPSRRCCSPRCSPCRPSTAWAPPGGAPCATWGRRLGRRARMASFAYGLFDDELSTVRSYSRPDTRLISSDGKLRYFYPRSLTYEAPSACGELAGHRIFVLLLDPDSIAQNGDRGVDDWLACSRPRTHLVAEVPDSFAAFVVGLPASRTAASGSLPRPRARARHRRRPRQRPLASRRRGSPGPRRRSRLSERHRRAPRLRELRRRRPRVHEHERGGGRPGRGGHGRPRRPLRAAQVSRRPRTNP